MASVPAYEIKLCIVGQNDGLNLYKLPAFRVSNKVPWGYFKKPFHMREQLDFSRDNIIHPKMNGGGNNAGKRFSVNKKLRAFRTLQMVFL